jgi:3-hydroxyisobutyrate dehydrogenase-like beta-hydroxyacid dehydrogenase
MTEDARPVVGFIGLGYMGEPMARQIAAKCVGRTLVFDESPEALRVFSGMAEIAASPREMASRADVIVASLPTAEAYREAVLGPAGIVQGARARVYVHVGTTGSQLVQDLGAGLSSKGIEILDAPMTGGPARARNATLTVMAAGSPEALRSAETFLRCYANKIIVVGEHPGAAQRMKVVNNIMSSTNLAIAAEALVLGVKGGLDPEQIIEVVNAGTGQNFAMLSWVPEQILTRNFNMAAPLITMIKDLKVALSEAKNLGISLPVGTAVNQVYLDAAAEGNPDSDDLTSLIWHMERAAAIEVPKTR